MSVDTNTYNSPAGKIDLTPLGTMAYSITGTTQTGVINDGTGAIFGRGADTANGAYFGNQLTWNDLSDLSANPVHIKFTPSGTPPALGCMIAIRAEFEHATTNNNWTGVGEVALYGRFSSDESDIRLLMFMGKPDTAPDPFAGAGWMTPNDGESACFIVHYRDIFNEMVNLQDENNYGWSDIKDFRLVFRNKTAGRKVKIREFRIYENVLEGPSGECTGYTSTQDSITFAVNAGGKESTIGAGRAGIRSLTVEVASSTTPVIGSYPVPSPVETIVGDITISGLPAGSRSEYIVLEDTYGNIGYITDSYGKLTLINGIFVVTPRSDWVDAILECSLTDPGMKLVNYAFYEEQRDGNGVVSMEPIESVIYDDEDEPDLPISIGFTRELNPSGGAKFQVIAYARGTVTGTDYFFKFDETTTISDTRGPKITPAAYSAQNRGFVSLRMEDASGVKKVEFILQRQGQPDLSYITGTYTTPYLPMREVSMDFVGEEGEIVTVLVKVWDGVNNLSTVSLPIEIYGGGDIYDAGYTIPPEITATIDSNAHVLLEWTSWAAWMPSISGVRYPPVEFEIFRKAEASGTYQQLADGLNAATTSYEDDTLTTPAIYYYCIVAVDQFEQRKSVEIAVDVAAATTQTRYSFVENYLQMLPKWTAAIPKTNQD